MSDFLNNFVPEENFNPREPARTGNQPEIFASFEQAIANQSQNSQIALDDNDVRFGLSLMFNIPLTTQNHQNFFGDYNKKVMDGAGKRVNEENMTAYPRLTLMPFQQCSRPMPRELPADFTNDGDYAEHSGAFSWAASDRAAKASAIYTLTKTAKQCASVVENEYAGRENKGFLIFHSATGENPQEVLNAYLALLPMVDFDSTPRNLFGFSMPGPFIYQILPYLENQAVENIARARRVFKADLAEKMRRELIVCCQRSLRFAHGQLDLSEAEMESKEPHIKKQYDRPNYEMENAPEPPDLVYLAHTNRTPIHERGVEAAGVVSKALIGELRQQQQEDRLALAQAAAAAPVAAAPPANGAPIFTMDQVVAMAEQAAAKAVDAALAKRDAEDAARTKAIAAEANKTTGKPAGK